jgi:hypothetical protein
LNQKGDQNVKNRFILVIGVLSLLLVAGPFRKGHSRYELKEAERIQQSWDADSTLDMIGEYYAKRRRTIRV